MVSSLKSRFDRFLWIVCSILVALMLTSAVIILVQFIQQIVPSWNPLYLPGFVFLLVLERWYIRQRIEKYPALSKEWLLTYLTEWIMIGVILRILISITDPSQSVWSDVLSWFRDYGVNYFTIEWVGVLVIVILAWSIAGQFADLINEYHEDQEDIDPSVLATLYKDRPPTRDQIVSTVFTLGAGLLLLTALTRINWRMFSVTNFDQGLFSYSERFGGSANLLVYFILGLIFLSISRFESLRRTWMTQGLLINQVVVRNWLIYSIVFLVVIGMIALLLPTSYTTGLLQTLGIILGFIADIFLLIFGLILYLFSLLFLLFSKLIGQSPEDIEQLPIQPPIIETDFTAPANTPTGTWFDLFRSIVFWIVLLGIVGYAFVYFIREHKILINLGGESKFMGWLRSIFKQIFEFFGKGTSKIGEYVSGSIDRFRSSRRGRRTLSSWNYFSLRKLEPKERIRFYYLALLRRAEEDGFPRKGEQTPSEYESVLKNQYEVVDQEIHEMTAAFLEARYSEHELTEIRSNHVQVLWVKIRKALRSIWRKTDGREVE